MMRWKGDTVVLARIEPRTKLEVIYEAGDQVRVRRGTDFGWVPFAALTSTPPPEAAAEDKSLFDTSNIQIDVGSPAGQPPAGQAPPAP
jgi:hypothetical protein